MQQKLPLLRPLLPLPEDLPLAKPQRGLPPLPLPLPPRARSRLPKHPPWSK